MGQPNDSILKNAYIELYNMNREGYKNWVTAVQDLLLKSNDNYLKSTWENQGFRIYSKYKIQRLKVNIAKLLQDRFQKKWFDLVNKNEALSVRNNIEREWVPKNKLRTYRIFKTDYKLESYLKANMNINHRKSITYLRTSSHQLNIEIGRRFNIPPEERICELCNSGVEDEYHFLCACPIYKDMRVTFFRRLEIYPEQDGQYPKEKTLKALFEFGKDFRTCRIIGDFCYQMTQKRNKLLELADTHIIIIRTVYS